MNQSIDEQKTKIQSMLAQTTNAKNRRMLEKILVDLEEKSKAEEKPKTVSKTPDKPIFQAVGQIRGKVRGDLDSPYKDRFKILIEGKEFAASIPAHKKKVGEALKENLATGGNPEKRFLVYPWIVHFPDPEKPYILGFQIVGFFDIDVPCPADLEDGEFILRGLWQWIPVCRFPVVSIYKNGDRPQKDMAWIEGMTPEDRARKLQPVHVPLFWKPSSVRPFRFNPDNPRQKPKSPAFVQVKAKFRPDFGGFKFHIELEKPSSKTPRYLRASPDEKEALWIDRQTRPEKG